MIPPDFSVLLLAWDEADPSVAVFGGSALPPTLPLVYQLAAQRPVLAVYPHLPAAEPAPITTPERPDDQSLNAAKSIVSPAVKATPAPAGAWITEPTTPGVRRLPAAEPTPAAPARRGSQIIGLNELVPDPDSPAVTDAGATLPARRQWPGDPGERPAGRGQMPAAPYVGATANATNFPKWAPVHPAPPAAPGAPVPARAAATSPPADVSPTNPNIPQPRRDGDLLFDPDPELPLRIVPAPFDEVVAEPGAAEAHDLAATEAAEVMPEAPAAAPRPATATAAATGPALPPRPRLPALDGLNFRMIQYARQATALVRGRRDFGVIYAPNWPAWLAALEIRNSSGQPLVLYAASLAADFVAPAERGWLLEIERMALRRAQLVLVPDETVRRRLRAQYGSTIGEVRVVAAADEAAVQRVLSEVAAD